ncbi:recombinase family protein [Bacillus cereus]|uniref:recombinase family protein n=1 Tax=Bacillus cereus group TaxID=86661 RepID=UPI00124E119D|nr:recombinase family protein [Bacillus cereus]KAB2458502.1 recombinase family protein [Bacillus cereus]KAB2478598.1 recombinase family protein [Bacillus cereus]
MIYGYARISDASQNITTQVEELQAFGCDEIIKETITGIAKEKKLDKLVANMKEGDTLVATRVDRLGRSTLQLLKLIEELGERKINLVIPSLGLDTRTPVGKAIYSVLSTFSELEKSQNEIKQRNGIESARRRGVHLGRKPAYTKAGLELAIKMYNSGEYTVKEIENSTQVSKASLYRALKK